MEFLIRLCALAFILSTLVALASFIDYVKGARS